MASVLWFSVVYLASIVSSTEVIECQGTARYTLTFRAEWTRQSHQDFPSSPHFSSLVGCSHKASYVMWTPGIKSTTGVKNVAEFGSSSALLREMDNQINLKNAHIRYIASGISNTGTRKIDIEVNSEYPLASFITMIAPSPDWFVGVHDYNLCDTTTGKWLDSRARDLPPYDAGTDSGTRFNSPNQATNPRENIHLLTNNTEGSFKSDRPVNRFGTFTFEKTYESSPIIKSSTTMQQIQPSARINAESTTIILNSKESSTSQSSMQQIQPTASINTESSTIILNSKENSIQQSPMQQIQPTASINTVSSTIILNSKENSIQQSPMQQIQPTASINTVSSTIILNSKENSTPQSPMQQIQPTASINTESTATIFNPKGSSSSQSSKQQIQPTASSNTKLSVPTTTPNPTATASVKMTPTASTTSTASSVKQLAFIYVILVATFVHLCL